MNTAFVIPVYRHGKAVEGVIKNLLPYGLPIILVDDGNDAENRAYIQATEEKYELVSVVHREKNGGKGKAMNDAVRRAQSLGFTHIFQVDADGQHDVSVCGDFLAESERQPDAVICGYPLYDESVPESRKKGREFSNGWARFVTLGGNIQDILCGFRIYPLAPFIRLINSPVWLDGRMGYDIEIIVRLLWKGIPLINKGVHVSYPADGISNFRMVRDNIGISLTFARLCVGMVLRLPLLLWRALKRGKK